MQSAVRSRIASFEAQSHASCQNGSAPNSPAVSHGTNRSRRSAASLTSNRRRETSVGRQSPQQQQQQSSREPPGVSPLSAPWNKKKSEASNGNNPPSSFAISSTSTTVTASQNRKSRLRQSHQGTNGGGLVGQPQQPTTNLLEKRKLIKERRLMQKQRRAAVESSHRDHGEDEEESHDAGGGGEEEEHITASAARSVTPTTGVDRNHDHHRHGSNVQDSPGRFAKIQSLTRRKGYENVVKRRNSSSFGGGQHQAASQQQQQQKQQHPSSSVASVTATNVTTGSSAATSLVRNTMSSSTTYRGSSKNSPTGQGHSPNHTTSTHSSVRLERNEQQGQMSMDIPTDDDATLTSVRRIMDPTRQDDGLDQHHHHHHHHPAGSSHNNMHGSYDSVNSSNGGVSSSSWRPLSSRKAVRGGNHRYHSLAGLYGNNKDGMDGNTSRTTGGLWMEEEKSDKIRGTTNTTGTHTTATGPHILRTTSSSDYDTDGDISKTSRHSAQRLLDGPSHSQATDINDFFDNSRFSQKNHHGKIFDGSGSNNLHNLLGNNTYNNASGSINSATGPRRIDDDERTFDYGDRDDDSNESTSYAMRRRKDAERRARLGADNNPRSENDGSNQEDTKQEVEGAEGLPQLLSKEDMEKYTKTLENPAIKLGVGVVGVATVGCIAFGPVGLLVGVAAVGLGFGMMQIPEEERNKIQAKAEKVMHNLQEKAVDASEKISSNCLTTYKDSGVADHLPHCLSVTDGDEKEMDSTRSENLCSAGAAEATSNTTKRSHHQNPNHSSTAHAGPQVEQPPSAQTKQHQNDRLRNKKVACLRNVRIMPVAQIHGLEPSAQPRAWLDIVASANTSNSQKNEAMEEILLLAKDKRRAKIFLDEGILDSAIWTLSRYFEKSEVVGKQTNWAFPDISKDEKLAAILAAKCCVILGKAHCAAIHTEGDLQLMSMYERGTVPEERQVAQMLHEVPHHTRITKTDDPTIVEPHKEVFALRQLTLPQAEELARSIKAVVDGRL